MGAEVWCVGESAGLDTDIVGSFPPTATWIFSI